MMACSRRPSLQPAQMSQECLGPKQYILTQVPPGTSTAICLDASPMGVGREVSKGTSNNAAQALPAPAQITAGICPGLSTTTVVEVPGGLTIMCVLQ